MRAVLAGLHAQRRRVSAQQSIPARFQWFLAPALLLLLWDVVASRRKLARNAAAAAAMLMISIPAHAQV